MVVSLLPLQGLGTADAHQFSGFSPSNVPNDYATDHADPASPDRAWGKRGKDDWRRQAVASVREERQLLRQDEARRKGV